MNRIIVTSLLYGAGLPILLQIILLQPLTATLREQHRIISDRPNQVDYVPSPNVGY
jgi:hypothetical protein